MRARALPHPVPLMLEGAPPGPTCPAALGLGRGFSLGLGQLDGGLE